MLRLTLATHTKFSETTAYQLKTSSQWCTMTLQIVLSKLIYAIIFSITRTEMQLSMFRNPTKGVIINIPDGEDVYHGVKIDYSGHVSLKKRFNWIQCLKYLYLLEQDVTPENFLKVISGDTTSLGKVVKRFGTFPLIYITIYVALIIFCYLQWPKWSHLHQFCWSRSPRFTGLSFFWITCTGIARHLVRNAP